MRSLDGRSACIEVGRVEGTWSSKRGSDETLSREDSGTQCLRAKREDTKVWFNKKGVGIY